MIKTIQYLQKHSQLVTFPIDDSVIVIPEDKYNKCVDELLAWGCKYEKNIRKLQEDLENKRGLKLGLLATTNNKKIRSWLKRQ